MKKRSDRPQPVPVGHSRQTAIAVSDFNSWYGDFHAIQNLSLDIPARQVTAFIGPSGCGKSTLLRWFNRMNDLVPGARAEGRIELHRKDHMKSSALGLSGGQQQRLCIARALAVEPEVLLMDEPCSSLDPKSTAHIEDRIAELRSRYTIVIVTHNMQQAARISDVTAFLYQGALIEFDSTEKIFTKPAHPQTEDYIRGRFG